MGIKMKKKMRSKTIIKIISLFSLGFLLELILCFSTSFSFYFMIKQFVNVNDIFLLILLIISLIILISIFIYEIVKFKKNTTTKFDIWLIKYQVKLIIILVLLDASFISIRNELYLSIDDLKDLVTLEWTIFGITIAIFLVWFAILPSYFKKKLPIEKEMGSLIDMKIFFEDKKGFLGKSTCLDNLILINIDLTLILINSISLYVQKSISITSQNLIVFGFFIVTNSLLCLFYDITSIFYEEKKQIKININNSELIINKKIDSLLKMRSVMIKQIQDMQISDEEKNKRIKEIDNIFELNS